MIIRSLILASTFIAFVIGVIAVPITYNPYTNAFIEKIVDAKNEKKEQKPKEAKKVKNSKSKKEGNDKNCTRDQPCNDGNENRKDAENKDKDKPKGKSDKKKKED
jgi:predicted membrane protein